MEKELDEVEVDLDRAGAAADDYEDGIEIGDPADADADETADDADSEESHEDADESEERETEAAKGDKGKGKNPGGNAVIAERRKWQDRIKAYERKAAVADKLLQASGAQSIEALELQIDSLKVKGYEEQGYDPQTAQMLVNMQRQHDTLNQQLQQQKFDSEVQSLKADPFFADIEDWRDELEPIAQRTGQSLEAVYMGVRGRERMKEYERESEQRKIAERTKKKSAKVDTSSGGGSVKRSTATKLTPDELAVAKAAGMSPEKYLQNKR